MKKFSVQLFFLFAFATVFAQSPPPQGINYQAVARNSSGVELANQSISVKFGIYDNDPFSSGILLWEETHSVTTNQFGLFTAVIGTGTTTGNGNQPTFANIPWGT